MATDPVCGMQVDERTAAGSSVFEGRSYYFCAAGCKKKFEANPSAYVGAPPPAGNAEHPGHAHHHAQTARESPGNVRGMPVVAGGVQATDPVCGMKVGPKSAAGSHEHAGITYHFCSKHCLAQFQANPAKYLTTSPAPAPVVAPKGAQYTCPMHPEIVQDGPGSCPKCGMALVPIAGTGAADDTELRDLTRRLWAGVALSIPLVVLAMAPMVGIHELFGLQPRARGWVEFALGTPVVLWVGWPILHKFWLSLRHWALNMYSLIGLGVGLA